jgi:two-component system sensor histidine kinase KdpD
VLASRPAQYAVALLSGLIAAAIALPFYPAADEFPALLLLAAVGLSAALGGYTAAFISTIVGFLILDFFFEAPPFNLAISNPRTTLDLLAFLLVALLIGTLNARLRRAHQHAVAARAEAEAALAARDEALAIVSHDLRTPLTAIKTSVSTLRNPGAPLTDATRYELLGTIEAEADRLVHFVADALTLTRLEAGIHPDRQWNALGEIVSAVLDRVQPVLGERPIAYDVPDTLPLARFDAGLLDQALSNILENVAVHTPSGTPLSISGLVDSAAVRVAVADAGPGIPASERARVLKKFERLQMTGVGTGLGLAIARAATEAQGGRLTIDDSPLGGVRVALSIPQEHGATEVADAR